MRHVGSLLLPAGCLLLWSSCALAQGAASPRATPSSNSCSHTLRPGCESEQVSPVEYAVCMTGIATPGGPTTYYMSGIFLTDDSRYANLPPPPPGTSPLPFINEFQQYVLRTYPRAQTSPRAGKPAVSCNRARTETEAKATFQAMLPSGPSNRIEVVQTGWKYAPNPPITPPTAVASAPAAAAPPSAAPAPPRAPAPQAAATAPSSPTPTPQPRPATPKPPPEKPEKKPQYVACWAEVPSHHTAYFSATFETQVMKDVRTEFHKMVMMTYGPVGQFNCAAKPSPAEAEQRLEQWKATARAKDTLVDTGWKP